jgi:hypothetical protein
VVTRTMWFAKWWSGYSLEMFEVSSWVLRVWQWNTSNVLWGMWRVTWHLKLDFIQMCWILIKITSSKLKCSNQWDKDRWSLKWILTKYDYSLWWSSSGRYLHLYLILSIGMLYYQEGCIIRSLTMSQCSSYVTWWGTKKTTPIWPCQTRWPV